MGIDRESFSAGVIRNLVLAAVETKSFARAEIVMRRIGETEISGRHIGRLAAQGGRRLLGQQRERAALHQAQQLAVEVRNPPELAVVELDGGRIRTRTTGLGPGTRDPAWKETKNALFLRMTGPTHDADPAPGLPESRQNRQRIRTLVREMSGSAGGATPDATHGALCGATCDSGSSGLAPGEPPYGTAGTSETSGTASWKGPQALLRTCLSSLDGIGVFGSLMAAEAHRKAFFQAPRRAFVADGMKCNWAVWRTHFRTFTPIVDLLHAISYVYHAAVAVGGDEDFGWGHCLEWTEALWQGRVEDILGELTAWLTARPLLEPGAPEDDPRRVVRSALTYLSNNRSRMDYPAYRRAGLPMTSSLMESMVKEMNWRVKGSEKFWNNPQGADAILALKAAALSDDNRLQELFQ